MSDLNEAIVAEHRESKLVAAIQSTGMIKPGLETQVAQLIGRDFTLGVGADGKPELVARSGKPVQEDLAERLGSGSYEHFRGSRPPGHDASGKYSALLHVKQTIASATRGPDGLAIGLAGPRH